MPANEYVRVIRVNQSLGAKIIHRLVRIVGPIAAPAKSDVRHQDSKSLTFKVLKRGILLPYIQAIAVAINPDKRFERGDILSALKRAEISRMPDLVHRREKVPYIIGEHAVRVGDQPDKHDNLQFNDYLLLVKHPENAEDDGDEDQGPKQGHVLVRTEIATRGKAEEPIALGDDTGEHESHQGVHSHGLERLERLAVALDVDQIGQKRKSQHRPSSGEEHVGDRPQRFVDRDPDAEDHAKDQRQTAIDKGSVDNSVLGIGDGLLAL